MEGLVSIEIIKHSYTVYVFDTYNMVSRIICNQFFRSFIPKFISATYKCKPISTVGAEQVCLLPIITSMFREFVDFNGFEEI